jgi:outer membrane immunogenic protein
MRRLLVALCLFGFVSNASAQDFDMPTLRGTSPFIPATPKYTRWAGFYFGGQAAQSSAGMDFSGATQQLITYLLRTTVLENTQHPSEWGVLGKSNPTGSSFGGFVGYNVQFSDVIVGLDVHYNSSSFNGVAPVTPITRAVAAGGNNYLVTVDGAASMSITDYGAARFRAGWVVSNFLPYATLGVAVGRADITRSANVSGVENPPAGYPVTPCGPPLNNCVPFSFSTAEGKKGAFLYGWSAGLGVDVLLMPNLFVRGEFEYTSFVEIQGIQAQIGTARVGAGLKF